MHRKAELGSFRSFVTHKSMKHVHGEKNTLDSLGPECGFLIAKGGF